MRDFIFCPRNFGAEPCKLRVLPWDLNNSKESPNCLANVLSSLQGCCAASKSHPYARKFPETLFFLPDPENLSLSREPEQICRAPKPHPYGRKSTGKKIGVSGLWPRKSVFPEKSRTLTRTECVPETVFLCPGELFFCPGRFSRAPVFSVPCASPPLW